MNGLREDSAAHAQGRLRRHPDPIEAVIGVVALIAVAVQSLAVVVGGGWCWGADAYRFLPGTAFWCGLVACAALAWVLTRGAAWPMAPAREPAPRRGRSVLLLVACMAAAGLLFWVFRIRHVLLGDGIPITNLLPETNELHPREPLASLLAQEFYRLLAPIFAHPGVPRRLVVQQAVGVGSAVAGVLFVPVALALARELVRSFPAREPESEQRLTVGLTLALSAQGYVQMFFGYVENYAYPVLVTALFVVASLRFLRGRGSLGVPLGVAALAVALDFTCIVLGPAVLVLVAAGLLDRARRPAVARDLVLICALAAVVASWLALGPAHYSVLSNLGSMLSSGHASADYMFSAVHARDFLNEHFLLGPFGLLLFLPVAAGFAWKRGRPQAGVVFLLVAGLSMAAACWTAPDLPMGYARDWDLYAPLGAALTAAAMGLTLALLPGAHARWRVTVLVLAVSLFHTAPWVALNASEIRSVRRFATLPLGGGRTENTIAFWYAERGDIAEAKRWLKRSLAADPENNRTLDLYGRIALDEHDPRLAIQAYLIAITLRPDKEEYRRQLVVALDAAGGPGVGLGILDTLLANHRDNGALWLERSMLLSASGRLEDAAESKRRALRLLPALAAFADTLPWHGSGAPARSVR
jgi:tetratricopeptide (TPR) repeat protein